MKTQGLVNGQRLLYREKKYRIKEKPEVCINGGFNRIVKTGGEGYEKDQRSDNNKDNHNMASKTNTWHEGKPSFKVNCN